MRIFSLIVLIFTVAFGILANKPWAWILLIVCVSIIVVKIQIDKENKKEEEIRQTEKLKQKDECAKKYKISLKSANVPANAAKITALDIPNPQPFLCNVQYYIWKENDSLKFYLAEPTIDNYDKYKSASVFSIPTQNIEHFVQTGEVFRETKISGGEGGGSSIGGAVVGGMVAGDAGAVIGSRKKTSEIKSETITHDTRETILNYFTNGNRVTAHFAYTDFIIFNDLLPKKEKSIVDAINANKILSESTEEYHISNITGIIQSLADLKEKGLLSNTEFEEKKKVLLEKIQ